MELLKYKPEDTYFLELTHENISDSSGIVTTKFTVKLKATEVKVYDAYGFDHWDNLTGTPRFVRFQGPSMLMYNWTNNCAKGIVKPVSPDASSIIDY